MPTDFKSNLEYLAEKAPDLDLYFTPTFGGEMDAVQILRPRVIFPMHDGGNERQYAIFAARLEKAGFKGEVGVASKSGDRFFYSDGKLVIVWPALRPSGSAIEPLGAGSTPFRVLDTTPGPGYPSFCYAKGRFQAQCGPIRERLGKANSYPSSRRWYASPIDRLA